MFRLKYQGVEHIWGWNGGGLLQMAFHNEMKNGPWTGDYNPTQAGDGTAMSPVTGIFCQGTDSLTLMTMMLDFNHNNGAYPKAMLAVWGGRVDEIYPAGQLLALHAGNAGPLGSEPGWRAEVLSPAR